MHACCMPRNAADQPPAAEPPSRTVWRKACSASGTMSTTSQRPCSAGWPPSRDKPSSADDEPSDTRRRQAEQTTQATSLASQLTSLSGGAGEPDVVKTRRAAQVTNRAAHARGRAMEADRRTVTSQAPPAMDAASKRLAEQCTHARRQATQPTGPSRTSDEPDDVETRRAAQVTSRAAQA